MIYTSCSMQEWSNIFDEISFVEINHLDERQ